MVLGFADEMKKLAENIGFSYDLRTGAVGDIVKNTHSMIKDYHNSREQMSEEQKAELACFRKTLIAETDHILKDTRAMLNTFKNDFEKMAQELHSMLAGYYKGEVQKPVHDMLTAYHNQMKKMADDFRQGHNAWTHLARSLSAKRNKEVVAEEITPRKKRKYSRRK